MAKKPAAPAGASIEDRIAELEARQADTGDEYDRKLVAAVGKLPTAEQIGAMVQGAGAVVEARLKSMMLEDNARSEAILKALESVAQALQAASAAPPPAKPSTRTGTIHLPSGPVKITISDGGRA